MKMKKFAISAAMLLCFGFAFLTGCEGNDVLPKPENTCLEFWVAEKVSAEDFDGHEQVVDMFGGYLYFGEGYRAAESPEEGTVVYPEHYVTYTVTAYPDVSSNGARFYTVTRIEVTDPAVSIGGITCDSTLEEFDAVFGGLGCSIQDKGIIHIATYGNTGISFADYDGKEIITVWVNVPNREGIDF